MTKKPNTDSRIAALIVRAIAKRRQAQKLTETQQQTKAPIQGFKQFITAHRAAAKGAPKA